jgi:hypothetical protein
VRSPRERTDHINYFPADDDAPIRLLDESERWSANSQAEMLIPNVDQLWHPSWPLMKASLLPVAFRASRRNE